MTSRRYVWVVVLGVVVCATACSGEKPSPPAAETKPPEQPSTVPATAPADQADELPPSTLETSLPPAVRESVLKPFTGDFDELIQRS